MYFAFRGQVRRARFAGASLIVLALSVADAEHDAHGADAVVHWTNGANQDVLTVLGSGGVFTTDFKGTNDAQVTFVSGALPDLFDEEFGGPNPGNNPSWVTSFVGNEAQGTGDGVAGRWRMLEPSRNANQLQFDFALPLVAGDRLLVADVDNTESYQFQAYVRVGGNYVEKSVAGWTHTLYSGQTGTTPDERWPVWNNGFLSASGNVLAEPLDVLTIDQKVDRIVFTNFGNPAGTPAIQFASELLPGDYNHNGVVDGPDYVVWRNGLGTAYSQNDYTVWREHFGQVAGNVTGVGGQSAAVPEPPGAVLVLIASIITALVRPSEGL